MPGLVYLMYHEISRPGVRTARTDGGYLRYVLTADAFEQQLDSICHAGLGGIAVRDAVAARHDLVGRVVITFDDGCASDLLVAAPLLTDRKWSATFCVTVEHVDRPGYLRRADVRQLAQSGFEVASHGVSHRYLSTLGDAHLRAELQDSRAWLQDVTGLDVRHLSCPGGRWSAAVARLAAECGYDSVSTSRPIRNAPGADPFRLGRFAVTDGTDLVAFSHLLHGRLTPRGRVKDQVTKLARALLGDRRYDAFRDRLLRQPGEDQEFN